MSIRRVFPHDHPFRYSVVDPLKLVFRHTVGFIIALFQTIQETFTSAGSSYPVPGTGRPTPALVSIVTKTPAALTLPIPQGNSRIAII